MPALLLYLWALYLFVVFLWDEVGFQLPVFVLSCVLVPAIVSLHICP